MIERMIRVVVAPDASELAADRMWQWGVRGITEIELADGRVELTTSVGNDRDAIGRALATLDPSWRWSVDEVDATPGESWKQFAAPVWFRADMVCVPAWIAPEEVDGIDRAGLVTRLDPAGAFGLGDHPTTRSSMAMVADVLTAPGAEDSVPGGVPPGVLDVGCGSGALAVLAAQLGAVGPVVGIDVADAAVAATRANAELNGVADRVVASTTPLDQVAGEFGLVVANILAPTLIALAPHLRRVLHPLGQLVVSGILTDRHDHVLDALAPLTVAATIDDEGWATVRLTR